MCLDTLDENPYRHKPEEELRCWKIFQVVDGAMRGCHYLANSDETVYERGETYFDKNGYSLHGGLAGLDFSYLTGFHCYLDKPDMNKWKDDSIHGLCFVCIPVLARIITACGRQNLRRVIVAREIQLVGDNNDSGEE